MPTSTELKKRRTEQLAELRAFDRKARAPETDGGVETDYTDDQRTEFDRRSEVLDTLNGDIERVVRIEEIDRTEAEARATEERATVEPVEGGSGPTIRQSGLAVQGWVRARKEMDVSSEQRGAMDACGVKPSNGEISCRICNTGELRAVPNQIARAGTFNTFGGHTGEQRADMGTGAGVGGETIPEGFVNQWEIALKAISQLRNAAQIMRTASGNDLPIPTTDDTGSTGELLAEGAAAAEDGVTTGSLVLNAFKYSSKLCKISAELLEDTAFNMAVTLGQLLGTRIARITNVHFTTGDGAAKPKGIVVASTQAFVMGSATAIDPDEIQKMPYELDPEYMAGPNTGWMMHNKMVAQVRLLRDDSGGAGTGGYMWQPGLIAGEPDRLAGYPVLFNQDMVSAFAVNAKIILFGALGKYLIRDVGVIRLKHLLERFAESDTEAFIAFSRHDGDLLDAGTNPVKHMAMAAV